MIPLILLLAGAMQAPLAPDQALPTTPDIRPEPTAPPQGPPRTPAVSPQQADRVPLGKVHVLHDDAGMKLRVGDRDFFVVGMNWDYIPVGYNFSYNLFGQPDEVIRQALDTEMSLLQRMGVNALRMYPGIPARWVTYIYEKYGIFTVLNPTVGRYGVTVGGVYQAQTDYSNPEVRQALKDEVLTLVRDYKDVPGVLMWLLGNENNYGLTWPSFEIEALPQGERDAARARHLYSLMGELIRAVKAVDDGHPVAIANGDAQYLDLIAEECRGLDIFGANVYRGRSSRDLFAVVKKKLGVPLMYTEFGADAYDARRRREDDRTQARYLLAQWQELYEQSWGKGREGNALGGFIFQWSDGWWKYGQTTRLDQHDPTASWPNDAYPEDFVAGQNNMNEEWWGICAKGTPDADGLYSLYPRTAYYALQTALQLPPYSPSTDLDAIRSWFSRIRPEELAVHYQADSALRSLSALEIVRVTGLRLQVETFSTGGALTLTPATQIGFDHMESAFADFEVRPVPEVVADLSLNVLGNVAENPIDQIFYERRGRPIEVVDANGVTQTLTNPERLKVYKANVQWEAPHFSLNAFYRTGHYHWGYEGDFFGLYREANYGTSIDIYDADAPMGVEVAGKRELEGLKIAAGPELWWGAHPTLIAKYTRQLGPVQLTVMDEEQLASELAAATSAAVPELPTRRTAVSLATRLGPIGVELGGLWGGTPRVGQRFLQYADDQSTVLEDEVVMSDTFGAKLKLTAEVGRFHWYAQTAYMGLVADAGPTQALTYTGWSLRDSGSGNQMNALTGVAIDLTPFQIAPNFLWQRPLVGPGPSVSTASPLRNILHDPFAVRYNRETTGAELLINFDPTPATFLWAWDNDLYEDAPLAGSLDLTWRRHPTSRDAAIGILADGTLFAFPGAPPARDLYDAALRLVSHPAPSLRLVAHGYVGTGEPNGDSQRIAHRYGGDLRVTWKRLAVAAFAKFNDWGPYDYYRDFNLTYPLQLMGDVGLSVGTPRWLGFHDTRIGLRGTLRYLNGFSPDFLPDPGNPAGWGHEYELRSYFIVAL